MNETILLPLLIFAAATLYTSVGHAGASGYRIAMALVGVEPGVMKPAALTLNTCVVTIATVRFYRAGAVTFATVWPFVIGSIPMAFIGGWVTLPGTLYKQVVGTVLMFAAYRLWLTPTNDESGGKNSIHVPAAIACGAGVGFLSGLTGTGGVIFLSPLLLLLGWSESKESAGASSAFILVNSVAALIGYTASGSTFTLPPAFPLWLAAAVVGGFIGSGLGSRRLGHASLRRCLAVVLMISGIKLMFV